MGGELVLEAVAPHGQPALVHVDRAGRLERVGGGDVRAVDLGQEDVAATNSFEAPRAVDVHERRLAVRGHRFEHEFPAHSVSVLRLPLG